MSCSPGYVYRPTTRILPAQSVGPVDTLNRSRLFAAGTYFRSIAQGTGENDLSLEIVITGPTTAEVVTLTIRRLGIIVETIVSAQEQPIFPSLVCTGGIDALRTAVNTTSTEIEMPSRGVDFQDGGGNDSTNNCVTAITPTPMTGGNGPPSAATQPYLDSIFTGNERTIVFIATHEDSVGFPVLPPPSLRIQQYDGTNFIPYSNDIQGACPS